ncbi:MAG: hypothetical protein ACI4RD_09670 [Kiritimatiellia bacterium]
MQNNQQHTVVFWGAGATAGLGMATTCRQNEVFFALSHKKVSASYRECLQDFKDDIFVDKFDVVCDLLTLLDDDPEKAEGHHLCGFSQRQLDIVKKHAGDLGPTDAVRKNRVVMMRSYYDWSAAMRILRLQRNDFKDVNGTRKPSDTFAHKIYNLLDVSISSHSGLHVFLDDQQDLSSFLDEKRMQSAKAALVMFINLVFACAWAKSRFKLATNDNPYRRFADWLSEIRAEEACDCGEPVFSTSFVSMNFDPILWWLIKNADARYNRSPIHVGERNTALFLGEDVDQADDIRPLQEKDPSVSSGLLSEDTARFVNERGCLENERCNAIYQTVRIFFPHGSSNFRICPCCGKTTLFQGNVLEDSSESIFSPFFFKELAWGMAPAKSVRGVRTNSEQEKWKNGELDYIQCRHCGRAIRMCDTEQIMQSGLKSPPPHVFQRIMHNVDNTVMGADHIVLMGYSLPPDDGAWAAELQARTTRDRTGSVLCSVIGYGANAPNKWLYGDELNEYCESQPVIRRACAVFGKGHVRANLKGIPDVFTSKASIKEIFYPTRRN